jgi:hypothetical protein
VKNGADMQLKAKYHNDEFNALHLAIDYMRSKIVQYLIDEGADIEATVNNGPDRIAPGRRSGSIGYRNDLSRKRSKIGSKDLEWKDGFSLNRPHYNRPSVWVDWISLNVGGRGGYQL